MYSVVSSVAVMAVLRLFDPWVMPLFFLVAGAASMFALRRRSNRQYIDRLICSNAADQTPRIL